jgi:hypothetical protein
VGEFTATKDDRDNYLVLVDEEALRLIDLELDVVLSRLGTETDLLDLRVVDVGLVMLLFLLVLELAKVHDPTNGRLLVGRHLYKIEAGPPRKAHRLVGGDDAELSAVGRNNPDWGDADLLVDAMLLLDGSRLRPRIG